MNTCFRDNHSKLRNLAITVGGWATRHSSWVLLLALLITGLLSPFAATVGYDDDVLQFLPQGDPEVTRFQQVGRRFHGLSIALLGIKVPRGDIFTVRRLALMRRLTLALRKVPGVTFASSLTELRDVAEKTTDGGEKVAVVSDLVGKLPPSDNHPGAAKAMARLRKRIMARDHVMGALLSPRGDATLILCNISPDAKSKDTADAIRKLANRMLQEKPPAGAGGRAGVRSEAPFLIYYGGAPFIGSYVADGTRKDIIKLAPFVCLAIILIILFTVRSLSGVLVALGSVGMGIAWLMGLMGLFKCPLTLVSSSLPVLLIALGSAYSIHLLARILANLDRGASSRQEAVQAAIREVAPPIFVAGLTTALGFLSFLVMDISPMREFGLWMSAGTLITVLLSLVVVPAACVRLPLRARPSGRAPAWALSLMVKAAKGVTAHPRTTAIVGVVLTGSALFFANRVSTHMETRRFFQEDSPPVKAEDFLEKSLGGSLFLQVQVKGDIGNPIVLRQIDRLSAAAAAMPGATNVQSVVGPVLLAAGVVSGEKRIPLSKDALESVVGLIKDDPNLQLLVDDKWKHALVQIKLGGFNTQRATRLAAGLKGEINNIQGAWVTVPRKALNPTARKAELAGVFNHLKHLLLPSGLKKARLGKLRGLLSVGGGVGQTVALRSKVEKKFHRYIKEDELIYLRKGVDLKMLAAKVADLLSQGKLSLDHLYSAIHEAASDEERGKPKELRKSVIFIHDNLKGLEKGSARAARATKILALLDKNPSRAVKEAVVRAVGALFEPLAILPAGQAQGLPVKTRATLEIVVSGYPMVYVGMNASVKANQQWSLVVAGLLVLLALAWFFKGIVLAVIALLPAGLTLLLTFGIMGAADIHMDVGTSMIASIALGVGIDYAVHFLWRHGVPAPDQAVEVLTQTFSVTGWGIVINALEVTAGFGLLLFGTIVPMRNFGLLTATAMMVSALLTLLCLPALTQWFMVRRT